MLLRKKTPKGNAAYKQGYVSFTQDEFDEKRKNSLENEEAYTYLDKALHTSSNLSEKDQNGDTVDIDDVYPVTREEAERMGAYLDKAEAVVKNKSDQFFIDRLAEIRGIVGWSLKRHTNYQWLLLIGVVVSMFVMNGMSGEAKKVKERAQRQLEYVENWEIEGDTTFVFEDASKGVGDFTYVIYASDARFTDYKHYKIYLLKREAVEYHQAQSSVVRYKAILDTIQDDYKKSYEGYLEDAEKAEEEAMENYENYVEMDGDDMHDEAIDDAKDIKSGAAGSSRTMAIYAFLFIIVIPLYFIAERPYGYNLTRHRVEAKVLGGIKKIMFWLGGALFGAGLATSTETRVHWSDGSKTTETNMAGLGFKLMLFAAAAMVICVTSSVLIFYMTIQGLRRNYDWDPIISNIKNKLNNLKASSKN